MRLAILSTVLFGSMILSQPSAAHISVDSPNGGETFSEGEIVTIQWHLYIAHSLINWDLWYATDNGTTSAVCGNQAGFDWIPIEMDYPRTCSNAGGGCGAPGGCTMQYEWTIPEGIASDQVKIRVRMDNSATDYWDVSNEPFTITNAASSVPDPLTTLGVKLWQSFPNPFQYSSTIPYAIAETTANAQLTIHDTTGRLVRELVSGTIAEGPHFVVWDGTDAKGNRLPSGTYLYRLTSGDVQTTRKLNLID